LPENQAAMGSQKRILIGWSAWQPRRYVAEKNVICAVDIRKTGGCRGAATGTLIA